jgi:putative transposase
VKGDVLKSFNRQFQCHPGNKQYMPRLALLDAPGVVHHIMIRGIERRNIFKDNKDRDNLIGRLALLLPETQTTCFAWALMPNHAHFLFRTGTVGLSTVMRRLLTGYKGGRP